MLLLMMMWIVHLLLLMDMLIGVLRLLLLKRACLPGHHVTGHLRPLLQRSAHCGRGGRQRHPAMVHDHVVQHVSNKIDFLKKKAKN